MKDDYEKFYEQYGKCRNDEDSTVGVKTAELLTFNTSKPGGKRISFKEYVYRMTQEQNDVYYITGENIAVVSSSPFEENLRKKDHEELHVADPMDEYAVHQFKEMCKAISAIKTLRRRWIVRSNVLSDELKEDEDLHNKLKSSDQANISDEQEFNTENKHFREKCKGDTSHRRVWHVEGHRSKQVRVFRCDSSMPVRTVKSCFQDIQQLLEEMNSAITASEATELDHKNVRGIE